MQRKSMNVLAAFSLTAAVAMLSAALLSTANVRASTAVAATTTHSRVARGEEIFGQRCVVCHNQQPDETAPSGGPPNLHGVFRGRSPLTTKQAREIIVNGKGAMPGWANVLTGSDIDNVIAYLKTR